jgi:hypothetical protein
MRTRTLALLSLLSLSTTIAACAPGDEEAEESGFAVSTDELRANLKAVKTDDFRRGAVNLATDELNDLLAGLFSVQDTTVYSADGASSSFIPREFRVKSIAEIKKTIAGEFGETELAAQLQKIRLDEIAKGNAKYFIEAGARKGGIKGSWTVVPGGFDQASAKVGFDAGDQRITRIVVAADDQKVGTLVSAIGKATKALRNFIEPRNADDIRALKPGEMIALRDRGGVAGTLGGEVPLFTQVAVGPVAGLLKWSAQAQYLIDGEFHDMQVVKLSDDEAVIDIGMEHAEKGSIKVRIDDRWGAKGLCDDDKPEAERRPCARTTSLGGKTLDLEKIAGRAASRALNRFTGVEIEGFKQFKNVSHVTLQRFKFHLNRGDKEEVNRAMELAMVGDLRMAQAMAIRDAGSPKAAVENVFDAMRASTTTTGSFKFGLFGFNIWNRENQQTEGVFELRTEEGQTNIAYNRAHRAGGWFGGRPETNHVGLAAQIFDAKKPDEFRTEANLLIQTITNGNPVDDDRMEDNIDGTLLALDGESVVKAIAPETEKMTALVWDVCSQPRKDQPSLRELNVGCNQDLIARDSRMKEFREKALSAGAAAVKGLAPSAQQLATELVKARVAFAQVGTQGSGLPRISYTVDVRLDDKALNELTSKSKQAYIDGVKKFVAAAKEDRSKHDAPARAEVLADLNDKDRAAEIEKAASAFERRAQSYRRIVEAERHAATGTREKGYLPTPLEVVVDEKADGDSLVASALLRSPTRERATQVQALFGDLKEASRSINGVPHEWVATYSLLSLVPQGNLAIAVGMFHDGVGDRLRAAGLAPVKDQAGNDTAKLIGIDAVGQQVSPINVEYFDLNAVIRARTQ